MGLTVVELRAIVDGITRSMKEQLEQRDERIKMLEQRLARLEHVEREVERAR